MEPIAIVIPVYNQPDRLREVVRRCLQVHSRVLVVDDGSDPQISPLVADLPVKVLRHEVNRGKGAAIRMAAHHLREQGATHLITLDADGQHDPEDLPQMIAALRAHPKALILGVRDFGSAAVPGSSRFGRAFGNFWVRVQTGTRVHDIQSGFRAYPVALIEALPCLSRRYTYEVEVVVRALWGGVPVQEVPVHVHYSPADRRGSHFHKLWDNLRLTALNTHLTMRSLIPWPHRQVADADSHASITVWHPLRSIRRLLVERATPQELMCAVALGVFLGAVPLIACHTLAILIAAALLRLNRVAAVAASQLCMPPVVPALCIEVGHLLRCGRLLTLDGVQNVGNASFLQLGYMGLQCLWDWCIGSLPVGVALAALLGAATYLMARALQKVRPGTVERGTAEGGRRRTDDGEQRTEDRGQCRYPSSVVRPPRGVSNARWDSRSVGKRWQFAFFALLLRAGGRRLAYGFMYLVVAWYVLLRPFARRRCRYYLNRRFPGVRNPLVRLWHDYRRIEALGESLIDRGAFGLLGPQALQVDFPEGPRLQELIDEGRGLIFLNSHFGCWQVAMSAVHYLSAPVSIVMHQGAADIDPRWFQLADGEISFSIIDPAQPMGGVLEMIAALKANHILGMMADRVFGDDPNTLAVPFLGASVHFPVSPYRLASMQGTPLAVVFSYKTGFSRYRIELARIIRVPVGLGRSNAAYAPFLQQFVEALEAAVSSHPWQFFNFHNMWQA